MDTPHLAEALLDKGAAQVVGWNGNVQPDRTDAAIMHLLRHHGEGVDWSEGATRSMAALGKDDLHGSLLVVA